MNILQCQEIAKNSGRFDDLPFTLRLTPDGEIIQCHWLDAFMGFFQMGDINYGFLTASELNKEYPQHSCSV